MRNWKRFLCVAMAAMLSCPLVNVHASEPEETLTLKMEAEAWMTEETVDTESTELTGDTQEVIPEDTEEVIWEDTEEIIQEDTEEAIQEDTEEIIEEDTEEISQEETLEDTEGVTEDTETALQEEVEAVLNTTNSKQPENPVYNKKTDTTKWSYVYFGRYVQNRVTGDDLDDSIINANYNKNGDAVVNGVKYRRVDCGSGKWRYYSYDPIKWKVMKNDGNTLLLITDQALFYKYAGTSTYDVSNIRSMLNGYDESENDRNEDYSQKGVNFLQMAFYETEENIIQLAPLQLKKVEIQDLVRIPYAEEYFSPEFGYADSDDSDTQRSVISDYAWDYEYNIGTDDKFYEGKSICVYNDGSLSDRLFVCPVIKISIDSDLWSMECPQTSFEAQSLDSASISVTLKKNSYIYDGNAKEPTITVKDGNEILTQDIDYTMTYQNNVQAGTAAVRIDGTGDYVGSKTVYFTIEKANQTITVNTNITKKVTDKKFKLGAQLTTGNGALSYQSDNTAVAKVDRYGNVTICGGGVANITVTAKETDIYKTASAAVTLTVEKIKPTLEIEKTKFTKVYGDKAFWIEAEPKEDVDITFTSNNKKVVTVNGEGKVSIKGCGTASITVKTVADNRYDSVKKTVKITVKPKKSAITSGTSKKKNQIALKWKKDSNASGYEIVYSYNGKSKKIDVKKNSTTSTTIKKLKSKKTYSVKIRAYKKVDGKKIYGDYSKTKKIKVK